MGNGATIDPSKEVYVEVNGKKEKLIFSRNCSTRDIQELIAGMAGVQKFKKILLIDQNGGYVTVSPTMPVNTKDTAYKVQISPVNEDKAGSVEGSFERSMEALMSSVAQELSKALKVDQLRVEVMTRLTGIERRIDTESLRGVEVEKCRKEIREIRDQFFESQKKYFDYNRTSPIADEAKLNLKRDVPNYPKYQLSQETIDYLKQPTFNIWHWEPNEMLSLLEHMYYELGLVQEWNINPITLKRWLLCVQENYRNNPFHNFRHCFCVSQMMYGVINLCKLTESIPLCDLGILLTSAVCHDLDHPGYNNAYQINARTELAIRYNNISPLENHHCSVAFQILSKPEFNIFANVSNDTFKAIQNGMIQLILATDMARHNEILEAFKSRVDNFDFHNDEHLTSLKMILIKCCDISNEVRPMEISEPWLDCLLEEYFNQSDREKLEGLPVAPFMDRDKVTKPSAQIGFLKFVLIPMFSALSKTFPQIEPIMVKPLIDAREHYERMQEDMENGRKKAENAAAT